MTLIRRFEEEAGRQYQRAKAGGFLHLAIGEEATIVGTTSVMEPEDYLIGTYRTHGHAIARGTDPKNVMAEIFGREDGTARGRGGSMHIFDGERRFMGGYGIVGGNLPIAAGLALASDLKGTDEVTVCMFGDGASNTGNFGETMNLAALWSLPIVFLVENNLYGMGTAIERHSAVTDLSHKAEGMGVPGERVDGMDVIAIRECVADHLRMAREDRRPTLVEAFTYRYRGHSAADPEVYRDKHEVEEWRQKDPIESFAKRLVDEGVVADGFLEEVSRRVEEQVVEAAEFADAPDPPLDSLYDNLYVLLEESGGWYAVDERTRTCSAASASARPPSDDRVRDLHEAGAAYARTTTTRGDLDEAQGGGASGSTARAGTQRAPRATIMTRTTIAATANRRTRSDGRTTSMRMREALNAALREEMERDESVFLMGEDIGVFEGAFKVTEGLMKEFGEARVRDTPISENTIVGAGVGAAMAGMRPVVELMTVNFSLLAFDQIINHAASIPYMFNGQVRVPMVVRMPGGGGHQLGPTHSHSFEAMFLQIPGILVACPSTAADGKALLKSAIRDDNPVVFIEHETLYGMRGEVPDDGDLTLPFGQAAVRREGGDVTIVGILKMAHEAERAATTLANDHGIEAEVIDPRTLRPLDLDTILESVRKTNRVVIVEEGWPHGGVGANLAALIQEQAFDYLDAPIQRVTGADVPMPYSKRLEQSAIPHPEHVVSAVLETTAGAR